MCKFATLKKSFQKNFSVWKNFFYISGDCLKEYGSTGFNQDKI